MHCWVTLLGLMACLSVAQADSVPISETLERAPWTNEQTVDYVLNTRGGHPTHIVILFPGGNGLVDPHIEDGRLKYGKKLNFLLRVRPELVDESFATVSTNASSDPERFEALRSDLIRRYPSAKLFLMGTSNGTFDVARLVDSFESKIDGFIFTSSRSDIWSRFNSKKAHVLIVHNENDACRSTEYYPAKRASKEKGATFLSFSSAKSNGEECQPFSPHGYWGIEKEVVDAIKVWMRASALERHP